MTRFWITIESAVEFVYNCINSMQGGEIFVPKMKSMKITDCIRTVIPNVK